MKTFATEFIRNVALVGHSGEGKTSLAEAMLYMTKTIDRLGKVDDGSATMDYDDEEIKRKISISMALAYAVRNNVKINLLDVPGFFDFEGEMVAALAAADSAIVVTSASGALTVGTEKALDMCLEKRVPAFIFVNAVNKENSDFMSTVDAITAKYNKVVPIELPIMEGGKMTGYVDVFTGEGFTLDGKSVSVPAALEAKAEEYKGKLMEMVAETDEELMMKFFEGEAFTAEEACMPPSIPTASSPSWRATPPPAPEWTVSWTRSWICFLLPQRRTSTERSRTVRPWRSNATPQHLSRRRCSSPSSTRMWARCSS